VEYDYINTVQEKQVISMKKYLPIFLNIFIVTGNQMFIISYGNKHLVFYRYQKQFKYHILAHICVLIYKKYLI
jgi:hypothetical protein